MFVLNIIVLKNHTIVGKIYSNSVTQHFAHMEDIVEIPGTWMLLEFSLPRVNSTDAITLCLQRVSTAVRCLSDCLRCYPRTCAPFVVSDSACRDGLNTPSR